jgi:glutamine amidotransferase
MNGLNAVDGGEIVRERLAKERPTLGICIGMQILFSQGTEHSETAAHAGVGIWDGVVSQLAAPILPHMGWNTVETNPASILFKGIETESFYFVHSYAAKTAVGKTQAWSTHGEKFLAAVEDGYISATQFHPEKSGAAGLALIKNWVGSL